MELPIMAECDVSDVVQRLYGLTMTSLEMLNSSDDKNYLVKTTSSSTNPDLKEPARDGYVLKILNSLDSKYVAHIDAMHAAMATVTNHGIVVPSPVRNCTGSCYSLETFPTTHIINGPTAEFIVRLFEYIPGELMKGQMYTPYLCYSVGRQAGRLDRALEDFYHPGFHNRARHWSLTQVDKLPDRLIAVKNKKDRQLLQSVIDTYCSTVLFHRKRLHKGVIHGDLNECNLLVKKVQKLDPSRRNIADHTEGQDFDLEVFALIDFGDSVFEHPLFEIATAMTYVMAENSKQDAIEAGGHTLAGFLCEFPLPKFDLTYLKECICARLALCLTHGTYEHFVNPNSTYCIQMADKEWSLLRRVWCSEKGELYAQLNTIVGRYSAELAQLLNP